MSLHDVSNILWRQRHLLEVLLFKLEEEQLVLASGRTRWLASAAREVETVLEEIRETEIARAALVESVTPVLHLPANPSLRDLAESAPAPWNELFEDHRRAYLSLTEEIAAATAKNTELLSQGAAAVRDVLASFDRDGQELFPAGYGPGGATRTPSGSYLIDEAL